MCKKSIFLIPLGVTHNRRADISPYVSYGTIDPHLGVIRVDTADGQPLATVWNFGATSLSFIAYIFLAIHGICYDSPNLNITSDVMGSACDWIEENVGGVAMFMNSDAGDINPSNSIEEN